MQEVLSRQSAEPNGYGAVFGISTLVLIESLPTDPPSYTDVFWDRTPPVNVVFASISNNSTPLVLIGEPSYDDLCCLGKSVHPNRMSATPLSARPIYCRSRIQGI